jgi:hypothetical protein
MGIAVSIVSSYLDFLNRIQAERPAKLLEYKSTDIKKMLHKPDLTIRF